MSLDVEFARSCFPALASGWGFFDNAGGSQTLGAVGERINEYLYGSMVAQGGPYEHSVLGRQRLDDAGQRFTEFMNATDPGEVIMGSSSTQLLQHLGQALLSTWKPGDRVIVSQAEHHANVDPWQRLADHGIEVVTWNVNRDSWRLELDDLAPLLTERTRLVAFTQCSNIIGSLHDVAAMSRFIHDHGVQVLVDGVAYAPHDVIDVRAWDVDYYVFSTYKTYGPHHAVLYGKRQHLLELPPTNFTIIAADQIPYKFQPGNANPELSHGAAAVVDYLESLAQRGDKDTPSVTAVSTHQRLQHSWAAIRAHEELLSARLLGWMVEQSRIRVVGLTTPNRQERVPTISFVIDGLDSKEVPAYLAKHKLGVRAGHFYALGLGDEFDFAKHGGVVRVSMVHYNTLEEVDRLIQHLDEILSGAIT